MKKIKCTNCGGVNKFTYKSFYLEVEEGKKELVTWCEDCLSGPVSSTDKDRKFLEEISTPFWKHMGLKPKPKEVAFEKYLKSRNMSYGEYRKEQAHKAQNPSSYGEFAQHVNKYGTRENPQNLSYDKTKQSRQG